MATKIKASGLYCAYLRKSRRDMELEALGQGETLARHEKALADLAQRLGVSVARWYREIVSGETIAERPQARQLLADVGAGLWDGVLVMDVDRLARGDSIDQGVIMQTMMYAGVLVITPDKIYDPNDEADAEFFEVKLFFARREYNMIKKRMQRGRLQSALDGCYQSPDLYGYRRYKLPGRRGWSLQIVPEQAAVVRSVFDWYAHGMDGRDVGADSIARRLNDMGLKTLRGNRWTASAIKTMLHNPTYAGKIRWNTRQQQFRIVDGRRVKSRPVSDSPICVDGLHEAIVPPALWDEVAQILASHAKRPKSSMRELVNPFAGMIVCGECGHAMQAKSDPSRRGDYIVCITRDCPTCGAYLFVVEDMVLDFLRVWVRDFEASSADPVPAPDDSARQAAVAQHRARLAALEKKLSRVYDYYEAGDYSRDEFNQRRADLSAQMDAVRATVAALNAAAPEARDIGPLIPQVRTVLAAYEAAPDIAARNKLLRTVIDRIEYRKPRRLYRNNNLGDYITLTIYPKYPQIPPADASTEEIHEHPSENSPDPAHSAF